MRRMVAVLTTLLVSGNLVAAQSPVPPPQPKCPTARMTVLGALIGFGAGAAIASPVGSPLGGNVFEDTSGGEQMMWFTVGGLTLVGAVVGHVLAQRCAAPRRSPNVSAQIVLSDEEVTRLAGTIRVRRAVDAAKRRAKD